jgi:hypothetical protein
MVTTTAGKAVWRFWQLFISIWWQQQPKIELSLFWFNNHVRETRSIFEGFHLGLRYEWFSIAPRPLYKPYHLDKCVDCGEQKHLHLSAIERIPRYSTTHPKNKDHIPDEERVFLLTRSRWAYTFTVCILLSPSAEGVKWKDKMFSCVFRWKHINAN